MYIYMYVCMYRKIEKKCFLSTDLPDFLIASLV